MCVFTTASKQQHKEKEGCLSYLYITNGVVSGALYRSAQCNIIIIQFHVK